MKDDINLARLMELARKSGTKLSIELCLHIVDEICKSVELVHGERKVQGERRPVSHRNLIPENILITPEGLIKVIGFGSGEDLARRDEASPETIELQVKYLSPEQASGGRIDERVEVYAAAAMLYELLTETPLFSPERKLISMLDKIQEGEFRQPSRVNPRVTGYLEQVLLRGLERDRSRRYQSASEFAFAIERILSRFSTSNLRDKLVAVLKSVSKPPAKTVPAGDSLGRKVELMGAFEHVAPQPDRSSNEIVSLGLLPLNEGVSLASKPSPPRERPPRRSHASGRVPVRRLVLLTLLVAVFSISYLENFESEKLALHTDDLLKSVNLSSVASTLRTSAEQISKFCRKKILASMP